MHVSITSLFLITHSFILKFLIVQQLKTMEHSAPLYRRDTFWDQLLFADGAVEVRTYTPNVFTIPFVFEEI